MMKKTRLFVFYFLLLTFAVDAGMAVAQSGTSMSISPGDTESLRDTFLDILIGEKKPGGLVLVKKDCGRVEKNEKRFLPNGPLEERLAFVTESNPEYRVSVRNDVVNLTPIAAILIS